jgi:hypothetical protein
VVVVVAVEAFLWLGPLVAAGLVDDLAGNVVAVIDGAVATGAGAVVVTGAPPDPPGRGGRVPRAAPAEAAPDDGPDASSTAPGTARFGTAGRTATRVVPGSGRGRPSESLGTPGAPNRLPPTMRMKAVTSAPAAAATGRTIRARRPASSTKTGRPPPPVGAASKSATFPRRKAASAF